MISNHQISIKEYPSHTDYNLVNNLAENKRTNQVLLGRKIYLIYFEVYRIPFFKKKTSVKISKIHRKVEKKHNSF